MIGYITTNSFVLTPVGLTGLLIYSAKMGLCRSRIDDELSSIDVKEWTKLSLVECELDALSSVD